MTVKLNTGLLLQLDDDMSVLVFMSGWDGMFHVVEEGPGGGDLWADHRLAGVSDVETLTRKPKAPTETKEQYFTRVCKEFGDAH